MQLSQRARRILFAVVTEFIATGDPVGSRTLARKYGLDLSAASIRNVLADLEEAGYLKQPHTSAGRIPTDRALRLFIDTLVDLRALAPEEQAKLGKRFAEIYAVANDPLREAGRYLSELSGAAAVIAAPRKELRTLSQLRFIPTRPGQLLAVLVFSDGSVENRFIPVDLPIDDAELTRIHNLLADVIEGRSLGEVRDLFARRLADDRVTIDALRRRAQHQKWAIAATAVAGPTISRFNVNNLSHSRIQTLAAAGLLLGCLVAVATPRLIAADAPKGLDGTWKPKLAELGGKAMPAPIVQGITLRIDGTNGRGTRVGMPAMQFSGAGVTTVAPVASA